jgi:hypothetical protein
MKKKLKLLIRVYLLSIIVIACCGDYGKYNYEVDQLEVYEAALVNDTMAVVMDLSGSDYNLAQSVLEILSLTTSKAYAISCPSDEFSLLSKIEGIRITSSADFSEDEPAGTNLEKHFKFGDWNGIYVYSSFEEVKDNYQNAISDWSGFIMDGLLVDKPTKDSIHTFTYNVYLVNDTLTATGQEKVFFGN